MLEHFHRNRRRRLSWFYKGRNYLCDGKILIKCFCPHPHESAYKSSSALHIIIIASATLEIGFLLLRWSFSLFGWEFICVCSLTSTQHSCELTFSSDEIVHSKPINNVAVVILGWKHHHRKTFYTACFHHTSSTLRIAERLSEQISVVNGVMLRWWCVEWRVKDMQVRNSIKSSEEFLIFFSEHNSTEVYMQRAHLTHFSLHS